MNRKTFFKTAFVTNPLAFVLTVGILTACSPNTPAEPAGGWITPTPEASVSAPAKTEEAVEDFTFEGEVPETEFSAEETRAAINAALSAANELTGQAGLYNAERAITAEDVLPIEHLFTPEAVQALYEDVDNGSGNLEHLLLNPGEGRTVVLEDGRVLVLDKNLPAVAFLGDALVSGVEGGVQVAYLMEITLTGTVDGEATEVPLYRSGTYTMVPQGDGWAISYWAHVNSFEPFVGE